MWLLLVAGLSVVTALHRDAYSFPGRNQRIIKLHSSPFKHHPHHKHIRPGPLGPHIHYHDHDNDHHYEYIRPNRPLPPLPSFGSGPISSSPHKYLPLRPSSYSPLKSSTQYAGPYKSNNNFRSPVIKDHFRGSSFPSVKTPPPSFDYVPSNPSLNHVINSDDDRGPIHEIPAPNLGPKPDRPVYHPELPKQPVYQQKPSYEVVESNDRLIEQSDGSKGYYAPDPDPSLPAPKIPPTNDPHSIPSEAVKLGNFPTGQEYQILEAGPSVHAPIPNLSSQELYDLMHSFPNDQYTVVLPQVYQPNSHQEVENNGLLTTQSVQHQYQDFNHPAYQTFNYEENNPNAAAMPMLHGFVEQDTSDTRNSPTVVRGTEESNNADAKKTESVKKTLPSDLSNLIPDDDFEKESNQSPIFLKNEPQVPFYSSLPNQETAETLAALQAAGSVASQITQLRGDQNPEDEESPFGLPKTQVLKPQQVGQTLIEEYDEEESLPPQKTEVEVQKSVPVFETSYVSKSLSSSENSDQDEDEDVLSNLDVGQGAISDKFGKKINPI